MATAKTENPIDRDARVRDARVFAFERGDERGYQAWRAARLASYPPTPGDCLVEIADLSQPTGNELARMSSLIRRSNFAIYQLAQHDAEMPRPALGRRLLDFAARFGLERRERHRSADEEGIVALEVTGEPGRGGYIPYTDLPLKWHTDGYYNAIDNPVRAFLLHCVGQAATGGESALLDTEIAYIRLRDEDPRFIDALMHPQAMTIPENVEADGSLRRERIGPVFSTDPASGALHMRFSARGRNIVWRDDHATRAAVAFLIKLLEGDEPLIHRLKLAPGQGVLCNNILHNRSGFVQHDEAKQHRLLYRVRYHDRISCPDQPGD